MEFTDTQLHRLYDSFWQEALDYFATGQVEVDPYLAGIRPDHRRGLSVILRPGRRVVDQFSALVGELSQVEPDQYYYQPAEFHITILSLFTATEKFQPYFDKIPLYRAALTPVLSDTERFTVHFRGITATKSTVMIQGYPEDAHLERLRDRVRQALHSHGLGEGLDTRYRITTAHVSILRFRALPHDLKRLVDVLNDYREYDFGPSTFETLQLVKNDWYMSTAHVEVLAEYPLL